VTAPDAPRVSVIVPAYNYGRFVGDALRSILAQSFESLEVIVIDDGSTDETPEVLARFDDPRLSVRRTDRLGLSSVRALGISLARAKLVAWLDADDLWRPTYLAKQVALLDAEPDLAFSFTNFERSENERILPVTQFDIAPQLRAVRTRPSRAGVGRVIEGHAFVALAPIRELPCWIQASVHRKSALEGVRPKPGGMDAEDLYFQLQVYPKGGAAFIDEPLVEVRRHGANSYTNSDQIREGVLDVLQQLDREMPLTPVQRAILRRRIGAEFCARGYRYFWSHDVRRASHYYGQALRWPGTWYSALKHLTALPLLPLLPRREPIY
jgi:glycosyltransferase involved in cell wall biosynthesis